MIERIAISFILASILGECTLEWGKKIKWYYEKPIQAFAYYLFFIGLSITFINPIFNIIILLPTIFILRHAIYKNI
jgi:hypothetical protein